MKKKFNFTEFESKMKLDLMKEHLDSQIRIDKKRKEDRLRKLEEENKSEYSD